MPPTMRTAIITRKQELAERLLQVEKPQILDEIDEILVKAEMQARVEESLRDIEKGNVMTIEEFRSRSKKWLRENGIG